MDWLGEPDCVQSSWQKPYRKHASDARIRSSRNVNLPLIQSLILYVLINEPINEPINGTINEPLTFKNNKASRNVNLQLIQSLIQSLMMLPGY